MRDRVFLDTNVLLYLYSEDEDAKRQISIDAISRHDCYTSTQALNEFCNVCTKKWKLPVKSIQQAIDQITVSCSISTVDTGIINNALMLHEKHGYSYYDCLILASALGCSCTKLFTEDMADGQSIERSLTITNIYK